MQQLFTDPHILPRKREINKRCIQDSKVDMRTISFDVGAE
jgi:hypothetical protein